MLAPGGAIVNRPSIENCRSASEFGSVRAGAWGKRADSFWEKGCFLGIEQLFFVRKETGSGTFNSKLHRVRFVGLAATSTSGEPKRTGPAKLGRFVLQKLPLFLKFKSSFPYVNRPIKLLKYIRFVSSICHLFFRALRSGGLTQRGSLQETLDNGFQVVAVGWIQPVICAIPFCY
jgi:hypothetical protein